MPIIPTMMAGLKFGPIVEREKAFVCLVLDIGSIGLCFIAVIIGGIEGSFVVLVHSNIAYSFSLLCGNKLMIHLFKIVQHRANLSTKRNRSQQRCIDTVTAHSNFTPADVREVCSRCMSKPFNDGTDSIRRNLLAKNIDDGLELEACGRNILAWEAIDIKVIDILSSWLQTTNRLMMKRSIVMAPR
jgi:hypothetical protein